MPRGFGMFHAPRAARRVFSRGPPVATPLCASLVSWEWQGKTIVVVLPDSGEHYLSTVLYEGGLTERALVPDYATSGHEVCAECEASFSFIHAIMLMASRSTCSAIRICTSLSRKRVSMEKTRVVAEPVSLSTRWM